MPVPWRGPRTSPGTLHGKNVFEYDSSTRVVTEKRDSFYQVLYKTDDVHGNQVGLLMQSKCFTVNTMTCGTPAMILQANESLAIYSQNCMTCHQPGAVKFCPKAISMGEKIKTNVSIAICQNNHRLPLVTMLQGSNIKNSYLLRTDKIAVYTDSSRPGR